MQLRASLFWDTDIQTIDFQQHKAAIIERIVMRGRREAFKIMLAFYGKEVVQQVILFLTILSEKDEYPAIRISVSKKNPQKTVYFK